MEELITMAEAARLLETTRQQVASWFRRRSNNGFPEPVTSEVLNDYKYVARYWRPSELVEWRKGYVPDKGGRPKML